MSRRVLLERYKNRVFSYTVLLMLALGGILLLCGWLVGGLHTILAILLALVVLFVVTPRLSARTVMRLYRGVPLSYGDLPGLYDALSVICRRAGLRTLPTLFILPARSANALSAGSADDPAIGISQGGFEVLSEREMVAVLAHEVAHIAHGDNRLTLVTELLRQAVGTVASVGIVFGIAVVWLSPEADIPGWIFVLLGASPVLAFLCQRAISRLREFAADMKAVELMDDPAALASALVKIDRQSRNLFKRLFGVDQEKDLPTLLQTHPETGDRIDHLMDLADRPGQSPDILRRPASPWL